MRMFLNTVTLLVALYFTVDCSDEQAPATAAAYAILFAMGAFFVITSDPHDWN